MSDFFMRLAQRALQPPHIHPRQAARFEGDRPFPTAAQGEFEMPGAEPTEPARPGLPTAAARASMLVDHPPTAIPTTTPTNFQWAEHSPATLRPQTGEPSSALVRLEVPSTRLAQDHPKPITPPTFNEPPAPILPVPPPIEPLTEVIRAQAPRLESLAPSARQTAQPDASPRERHELPDGQARHPVAELAREHIHQRVERLIHSETALLRAADAPGLTMPKLPQANLAAGPRVEINIGRIEILPAEAPRSPPRQPAPAAPSAMSLDAYLNERSKPASGGRA